MKTAWFFVAAVVANSVLFAGPATLEFPARSRGAAENGLEVKVEPRKWQAAETAFILCDFWDSHHCANAVKRVEEMAPRMAQVVAEARARGLLVIHAPSDCMASYEGHLARKRAQEAPKAPTLPAGIGKWLNWKSPEEEKAGYPIDASDGGEDDTPEEHTAWQEKLKSIGRNPRSPWLRQHASIAIDPDRDAISDRGEEIWNLLEARGIKNVLLAGVHANMCVSGRPFGLRQLSLNGKNVVLLRDLTDAMYNPARPPFVSHYRGTELIIGHIERFICPSASSGDVLGGTAFSFSGDARPHLALMISEDEYHTWETVPDFAERELGKDFRLSYILAPKETPADFAHVDALATADILLVSCRRRLLPEAQLAQVKKFVASGKPLVGIRTASHAFASRDGKVPPDRAAWPDFDGTVLGGNYQNHFGNQAKTFAKASATAGPAQAILRGVPEVEFPTGGSLYKNAPLRSGSMVVMSGRAEGIAEAQPVAWTHTPPAGGRVFYTSLGHPGDFKRAEFRQMLANAVHWAAGREVPERGVKLEGANAPKVGWQPVKVPGVWEDQLGGQFAAHDGVAWYRCQVHVPAEWKAEELAFALEGIDNAAEVFWNGQLLGGVGRFPPDYRNGIDESPRLAVPAAALKPGAPNVVSIRLYDHDGRGGFKTGAPRLLRKEEAIVLTGDWLFRPGDDPAWAREPGGPAFSGVTVTTRQPHETIDGPLEAAESAKRFHVAPGLAIELALAEPIVRQPLHLSFDARGRLWVVQSIQYPKPAGLKEVSRDKVWRTVYDRVPPPPPHAAGSPFRGADRISIHEDTDGDGKFDKHSVFLDGLNMATSVAHDDTAGKGLWVLQPPYLLFYSDDNRDDIPDGPPELHLSGFGLEDTHSIANSLCWGPDGWLYGAHGSTVSAAVLVPNTPSQPPTTDQWPQIEAELKKRDSDAVKRMGQFIWRYEPRSRRFEIFAEGGGNAYGLEIDSAGRVYSGHNGGDTRGFHYVQGGYFQKGFEKHGELSNPYAFGYFPAMKHEKVERFTHQFIIYESDTLPAEWRGKLIGVDVLHNNLVASEITPDGSTFKTRDVARPVTSDDHWFRPVMVIDGPDGCLYIADWYDKQVNHYRNQEGQVDHDRGRVWRVRPASADPRTPPLFGKWMASLADNWEVRRQALTSDVHSQLKNPNRWIRQTALRLSGQNNIEPPGDETLEGLWLWDRWGMGGPLVPPPETWKSIADWLDSPDPTIRCWAVRQQADRSGRDGGALFSLVSKETDPGVRSQLASTLRRLKAGGCLMLASIMAKRDADVDDPHIPLLIWWAIESKCGSDPDKVLRIFEDKSLWQAAITKRFLLERVMKRFAMAGKRDDLLRCAHLFELAPDDESKKIVLGGFEEAFKGRTMTGLPEALLEQLAKTGGPAAVALRMRQGDSTAIAEAMLTIADAKAKTADRLRLLGVLGEVRAPGTAPFLLSLLRDDTLRPAALGALQNYTDAEIAARVVRGLQAGASQPWPAADREAALSLLSSREAWALALVKSGVDVPLAFVRRLSVFKSPELGALVENLWGRALAALDGDKEKEIGHLKEVLGAAEGVPKRGQETFSLRCLSCHTMFGKGGVVGPDLTSYQRNDLDTLLLSVVAPGAEIREGFQAAVLQTTDGAALTGFVAEQDPQVVVLRDIAGQRQTIPRTRVASLTPLPTSLMPEGLLAGLDDQALRDFFAYLRSTTPPF